MGILLAMIAAAGGDDAARLSRSSPRMRGARCCGRKEVVARLSGYAIGAVAATVFLRRGEARV